MSSADRSPATRLHRTCLLLDRLVPFRSPRGFARCRRATAQPGRRSRQSRRNRARRGTHVAASPGKKHAAIVRSAHPSPASRDGVRSRPRPRPSRRSNRSRRSRALRARRPRRRRRKEGRMGEGVRSRVREGEDRRHRGRRQVARSRQCVRAKRSGSPPARLAQDRARPPPSLPSPARAAARVPSGPVSSTPSGARPRPLSSAHSVSPKCPPSPPPDAFALPHRRRPPQRIRRRIPRRTTSW